MKKFFNEFQKWFFRFSSIFVVLILTLTIRVNYYIDLPGNLTDIKNEITIDDGNTDLNGKVSSVYVITLTRPTLFQYLVAKNLKYSCVTKIPDNEVSSIDTKLDMAIGRFDSLESFSNAELAAYSILNSDTDFYKQVTYIYSATKDVDSNMKYTSLVGHMVNGFGDEMDTYPNISEIKEYLDGITIGENCIFTLEDKDGNKKTAEIRKRDVDGSGILGITFKTSFKLTKESFVKVGNVNTIGPSGGAMQALYIYLSLVDEDLLKGREIAGTGTISYAFDNEDNIATFSYVGAIGCVEQKLYAAYLDGASVFYCPKANYDSCMKAYEAYGFKESDIRVVKVSVLDDIINDLRSSE